MPPTAPENSSIIPSPRRLPHTSLYPSLPPPPLSPFPVLTQDFSLLNPYLFASYAPIHTFLPGILHTFIPLHNLKTRKAYDCIHRGGQFKTLTEFGAPKKLVGNENITHLANADYIVLLSHTAEELTMIMQALESTAVKFGLRVSPTKTKYMIVGRRQQTEDQEIRVNSSIYKRIIEFKYLGTMLSENGSSNLEIKARIQAGNRCSYALNNILISWGVSQALKLRLYKILMLPVTLNGCQSWSARKQYLKTLAIFERRCVIKSFDPFRTVAQESGGVYTMRN
ncbi:hypothetical protein J437_LFUL000943 [Ladona fulva]|uniref:Reverse transcriptase domain-containing protein n=1 Tax=Ladona fulva TaxID=123851 RepID=A0A8K0K809_LADFU|nr:hypothetical protein J437_LFUL000943 [Ladona fulva]